MSASSESKSMDLQFKTDSGYKMPKDIEFLLKATNIIQYHIGDCELNISGLCRKLSTSRTQLHNRIKSSTGMSATQFIRTIRLAKAKELLSQTDMNISEIAYQCGFRLHHYFSRVFAEAEGCSPTVFRRRLRSE